MRSTPSRGSAPGTIGRDTSGVMGDHNVERCDVAVVAEHRLLLLGLVQLLGGHECLALTVAADSVEHLLASGAPRPRVTLLQHSNRESLVRGVEALRSEGIQAVLLAGAMPRSEHQAAAQWGAAAILTSSAAVDSVVGAILAAAGRGEGRSLTAEASASSLAPVSPVARVVVPQLSERELTALRLYTCGFTLQSVALRMHLAPSTVKQYLDRVRDKYSAVARPARTRHELFLAASADGLLDT